MSERDENTARAPAGTRDSGQEPQAGENGGQGDGGKGGHGDVDGGRWGSGGTGKPGDTPTQLVRDAVALLLPLAISGAGLAALVVGVGGAHRQNRRVEIIIYRGTGVG